MAYKCLLGVIFIAIVSILYYMRFISLTFRNTIERIDKNLKVCILVISARSERWDVEKQVWKAFMDKHSNIDCFFLECDDYEHQDETTIYSKCEESFRPGILLKTMDALKKVENKYDFYIRSNLSTFFIFDRLYKDLSNIPTNKIIYGGQRRLNMFFDEKKCKEFGYFNKDGLKISYIGGTTIILNNKSNTFLLNHWRKYYKEFGMFSDDTFIGIVFDRENIPIYESKKNIRPLYIWNNTLSIQENLTEINTKNISYIRKREMKDKEAIYRRLLKHFYNIDWNG
uniref:Uncharacterized protein n=1 Tax=Pyramimonas orientalis virus TaxID=455367 RepID=A0A7L9AXZ2_POV01|nr:hypothetical protein HWQ62_00394 [Pyramimonas orientalis virus]